MIPIVKLVFTREEEEAVLRVLRSGCLTQGPETEKFEEEFAHYLGCKFAVAVSSGTTALHLALLSLGLKKGDEAITTPFSFIASTNAILYVGAKPVFVDIGQDFNIDVAKIEEKITSKTRVILPVHLFGNPCEMDEILSLARKYKLVVVEDACQVHGAEYKGKRVGTLGKLGCFSFYATKNMTTGEGGMIVSNDKKLDDFFRKARNHGSSQRYFHQFLGYNFRMTEMQAALGRVQLKKLDWFNKKRRRNALYLNKNLKGISGIILPKTSSIKKHVFHQYTIIITEKFPLTRPQLIKSFDKKGIGYSVFYPLLIHQQEEIMKIGYNYHLPVSEALSKEVISLPIHPGIERNNLDYIIETIRTIAR